MRPLLVLGIMALVVGAIAVADVSAAEVSKDMLVQMGLGGMTPVADSQGELVRGKGFTNSRSVKIYQSNSSYIRATQIALNVVVNGSAGPQYSANTINVNQFNSVRGY